MKNKKDLMIFHETRLINREFMGHFPFILENIQDLTLDQIQALLGRAKEFKYWVKNKDFSKIKTPYPFTVATFFQETSTRTKLSFQLAVQNLGGKFVHLDASTSSLQKGEDLEQTFLTLAHLGVDLCVYRTPQSRELNRFKQKPPLKIINAGDGTHQHPTQALLDLFTMLETGHSPQGKTITIIGDCRHSRVCHSLMDLLPQFGARIILCGPESFLPKENLPSAVTKCHSVEEALAQTDMLYLLRVQKERHLQEILDLMEDYPQKYGLSLERLSALGKRIPVFHAGPVNIGIEMNRDLIQSPLYMGHAQVHHGPFMRMSLLQYMLNDSQKGLLPISGTIDGVQPGNS